jgi:DNA-binding XRE family transcriptional regulator
MTEYYGLSLTNGQIRKIIDAADKQSSVTIRLSKDNLRGSHKLPLTKRQINQIEKSKTGMNLTLSYAQIKHVNKMISDLQKRGGIIPLLTLIPIIASALAAAGGLSGGVAAAVSAANNAKAASAAQAELERHNRTVEDQLKSGSGTVSDYVAKVPVIGNFLKPLLQKFGMGLDEYNKIIKGGCVCLGKGLFLKPYGAGLYISPEK